MSNHPQGSRIDEWPGEMHCIEVEPTDPRLKEASVAMQSAFQDLQALGWSYGETRGSRTVFWQYFKAEEAFLDAFEQAAHAVGQAATIQEIPCVSAYDRPT